MPSCGLWLVSSLLSIHFYSLSVSAKIPVRGPPLPSTTLHFSTLKWSLANANRSIQVSTPFLNQPHLALVKAGLIDEPNIGLNEGTTRWVGEEKYWTWETKFELSHAEEWQDVNNFYLIFNGLDTYCDVQLGGEQVGSTDNAFRSWVFDGKAVNFRLTLTDSNMFSCAVTGIIRKNRNKSIPMTLRFDSAWATATRLANQAGHTWFPPGSSGSNGRRATTVLRYEYSSRNWARKQQSDFGWDWGPAYLPSGPTQPAYLIGLSGPGPPSIKEMNLHRGIQKSAPLRSSNGNADHHNGVVLQVQKRRNNRENLVRHDADSPPLMWVHRSLIDIYRQGQRNNLPPNQSAPWIVNITLPVTSPRPLSGYKPTLSASFPGTSIRLPTVQLTMLQPAKYRSFGPNSLWTAEFVIQPDAVELWYPSALGNPKLYDLKLTLEFASQHERSDTKNAPITQLTWYERVGFRTVIVDQSQYSDHEVSRGIRPGTRFTFEINGKPFYAQGSSMIPIDTFAARTNSTTIRWLVESALLAHQNVIRVWGGGAYESDEFYDTCDELGILVWSEAVFACAAYPISPESFLDNIRAEVSENVARLSRHPSTALWAGNNEGEGYLMDVKHTWPNGSVYFDQYDYLNNHVIRDLVLQNTRSASYIPSSTTQGYLSLEPYVSRYGASTSGELYGDQEHYNYDTSISFNTSSYPVARFVNEFGFHSLASIYTLDRILQSEEDYHFNSSVIRAHNKNPPAGSLEYPYPADRGQNSLMTGVTRYYPTPNITGDARALLAQWAYASQVFQAAFMASQISYYRLGASRGERNMGAVYWQLNDVWEGTSWSSIEYTGRWKIFHYLAERVQSHVIITPIYHVKNETLDIYVTSDLWEDARGTAQLSWYDFAGHQLSKASKEFIVGPLNSTRLLRTSGLSAIVPNGHPPHDAWLHLTLTTNDGKHANEQFFHPVKLKDCLLRPTKVSSRAIGHNQISLQVAHGGVAAWVNVEHPPGVRGYFKDMKTNQASNAIFLRPNETRNLEFVVKSYDHPDLTRNLESKMVVRTMWDNQHR
ncbi:hypothetical protein MJO28_007388 [Puccinia striiformis f. sp. tritici]|uniref:Uncharacterized protein n=1 Tax=Puccinia striiformis f. sp. tritici TaxID=168172 RepID=A0ACC0EFY6_9BASI|nr:hypothetical protein MJO28_007388 [Puccinia striiformis f. sp. tritici]